MAKTKEISLAIDIGELERQIEQRRRESDPISQSDIDVRSTVMSLGKDPRVGTKRSVSTPHLHLAEVLKDSLENPFVEIHWRIPRADVDRSGVKGFNVYRRRLPRKEVTAETRDISRVKLLPYSNFAMDRFARNSINKGKFSAEKKSIYNVRRGLIPLETLNPALSNFRSAARARFNSSLNRPAGIRGTAGRFNKLYEIEPTILDGEFNPHSAKRFEKIAYIDYTKFLAKEKQKFIFVTDRENIELSYQDKKVGYGEEFEYYVTSVSEEDGESPRSGGITLRVEDLTAIRPPSDLRILQLNEREIQLRICADPRDNVGRALIYRRGENEINFVRVAALPNVNDCIQLVDSTVQYGRSYVYRVFMENIHGTISEPEEIDITSTAQRITPGSRSNNLKIPIMTVVQDQNSDFIKVVISSNDPNIAFYELERRDLSINERRFSVPSKGTTGYGGDGWTTNKLFVNKQRNFFGQEISEEKELLNVGGTQNEIIFIDDAVQTGHIYQYRVKGCDLFCNTSPYALSLIRAEGKKRLRTPINLKSEILRVEPFRIKISWDNDNQAFQYTEDELFSVDTELSQSDVKFIYRVQRRKLGETQYDSFPWTANQFIIDEAASVFSAQFSAKATEDNFVRISNREKDSSINVDQDAVERPANFPRYLDINAIYFYRVEARDPSGERSNFTQEFEVSTLPDLSDPINFKAEVLNTKVRPLIARLTWSVATDKARPDHWIIERKFDVDNDSFQVVGRSYIDSEFFDRDLEIGRTYLYRIKSVDILGRESDFFDARLSL